MTIRLLSKRSLVRGAVTGALAVAVGFTAAPLAAADDTPRNAEEAQTIVDRLLGEQKKIEDQYQQAVGEADKAMSNVDAKSAEIVKQEQKISQTKKALGQSALVQFQNQGANGPVALVFSTDTQKFLKQASAAQYVQTRQASALQQYQTQQANLTDMRREIQADTAKAKTLVSKLADLRTDSAKKVQQAQAVRNQLTEAERARYEQTASARTLDQASQRPAASTAPSTTGNNTSGRTASSNNGSAATTTTTTQTGQAASSAAGLHASPTPYNNYFAGQCTWWAFERRRQLGAPVGGGWGNASSWAAAAAAQGFPVNGTPQVGAVMVSFVGYAGHVAVVESVNGSMMTISEMNFNGNPNTSYRTLSWAGLTFIH